MAFGLGVDDLGESLLVFCLRKVILDRGEADCGGGALIISSVVVAADEEEPGQTRRGEARPSSRSPRQG